MHNLLNKCSTYAKTNEWKEQQNPLFAIHEIGPTSVIAILESYACIDEHNHVRHDPTTPANYFPILGHFIESECHYLVEKESFN